MNPDRRIKELEIEIALMENIEETARLRLSGQDEEWNAEREKIIEKFSGLINSYKADDAPAKATYILGQLVADANKLSAPRRLVDEIDNKRKMLHALLDERERQEIERKTARDEMKDTRFAI